MKSRGSMGTIATLTLACVLGVTLLLSLAAGAGVYRRVADRVTGSAEERVALTYIAAKIHGSDSLRGVMAGKFGGGDAVYLYEDVDGGVYETILYVHDGWLREIYCEQGEEPNPGAGETISEAASLSVTDKGRGLLGLAYTEIGGEVRTADVFVRSGG